MKEGGIGGSVFDRHFLVKHKIIYLSSMLYGVAVFSIKCEALSSLGGSVSQVPQIITRVMCKIFVVVCVCVCARAGRKFIFGGVE